jgi:hypothetical protein
MTETSIGEVVRCKRQDSCADTERFRSKRLERKGIGQWNEVLILIIPFGQNLDDWYRRHVDSLCGGLKM